VFYNFLFFTFLDSRQSILSSSDSFYSPSLLREIRRIIVLRSPFTERLFNIQCHLHLQGQHRFNSFIVRIQFSDSSAGQSTQFHFSQNDGIYPDTGELQLSHLQEISTSTGPLIDVPLQEGIKYPCFVSV
jgi:hypothetical protein